MRRAIFVDRDGVICYNRRDHVKSWQEFEFIPGVLEALAHLARLDLPIVVITNQAAIHRGLVPADVVEDIHVRMVREIESASGRVDRVFYCPHRPDEHCECRKPAPGMLLQAAGELSLDLAHSYLIGDAKTDMQAGRAVGCQRYLVLTGRGQQEMLQCLLDGEFGFRVMPNLGAAASAIARQEDQVMRWGRGRSDLAFEGALSREHR
jgi:D-glycero-D-manno-heptose 1,7-bisphosphate phosphatase